MGELSGSLITSPGNGVYLAASGIPANAVTLYLKLGNVDYDSVGDTSHDITHAIPISSLTNGLFLMPTSWALPNYFNQAYWLQSSNIDGSLSAGAFVAASWTLSYGPPAPFYDGRVQLKQNLIFQYRVASTAGPFGMIVFSNDFYGTFQNEAIVQNPSDYLYAGFYDINNNNLIYGDSEDFASLNIYLPFEENELYGNFVFNPANIDANGYVNTGVKLSSPGFTQDISKMELQLNPTYLPSTNSVGFSPALGVSQTRWLCNYPVNLDASSYSYDPGSGTLNGPDGLSFTVVSVGPFPLTLHSGVSNYWGLPFLTTKMYYTNDSSSVFNSVLNAGSSITVSNPTAAYMETAQPQLQTVEYDFWQSDIDGDLPPLPGSHEFSITNQSDLVILGLGGYVPSIAAYEKVTLLNGYNNSYGYLQQYLDKAYKLDASGNVTTNQTGVVSPYGSFFATDAGAAALLTMPDPDTSARGTCTVYCVSLALDKNHDGKMDLSFNGADNTSTNSRFTLWANNNYDRGHTVDGSDFEQDDMGPADIANGHLVPDCQYTAGGFPAIPCTRDLQDYFRLWTPGVAALMKVLPANYTIQLTLSGDGQIRVFQAVETNGGTNYLFDETTASNQVADSASLYAGLLTSSKPIIFNHVTDFNEHFIFCGAQIGSAQIDLQILDGNQNVVADAPVYLQINDIKQMYERYTLGDVPTTSPPSVAVRDASDLPTSPLATAFQYPFPTAANTPYILFVHGWNLERWEKDRYAETAYKRLYWQGYQGRFGSFRWPTGNGFSGIISAIIDARNYDNSEFAAWQSAVGLTNLLTQLDANYPGHVYLMAHSMGNVVAGEALRRAGSSQLANTYVAMQGAVPAHCYDASTVNRTTFSVPDRYAHYSTDSSPTYFNGTSGAGSYFNFYNTNDYALSWWNIDQNNKPDIATSPGYHYSSSSGFYKIIGAGTNSTTYLNFPGDTYEIFAYGDPAWSYALGTQPNVSGAFKVGVTYQQVELEIAPYNFGAAHKYHSGQFRSDNMSRAIFWNAILNKMNISP